jgi:hypothetical protein
MRAFRCPSFLPFVTTLLSVMLGRPARVSQGLRTSCPLKLRVTTLSIFTVFVPLAVRAYKRIS